MKVIVSLILVLIGFIVCELISTFMNKSEPA